MPRGRTSGGRRALGKHARGDQNRRGDHGLLSARRDSRRAPLSRAAASHRITARGFKLRGGEFRERLASIVFITLSAASSPRAVNPKLRSRQIMKCKLLFPVAFLLLTWLLWAPLNFAQGQITSPTTAEIFKQF